MNAKMYVLKVCFVSAMVMAVVGDLVSIQQK